MFSAGFRQASAGIRQILFHFTLVLFVFGQLAPAAQAAGPAQLPSLVGPPLGAGTPASLKRIKLQTLRNGVKSGDLSFKVVGDGINTARVKLVLTNRTKEAMRVLVPLNEILIPNNFLFQHMMVTRDVSVLVQAGQSATVMLPTMCVSAKSIKPPPSDGVTYSVGDYPDQGVWKRLAAILAISKDMERRGLYEGVPIDKSRRQNTIAQLATWMELGKSTGKPEDLVNRESITEDLLAAAGLKRDQITPKQKESLEAGVDKIFAAADLTLKRSTEPGAKALATLPVTSWETFQQIGARALLNRQYTEAEELLSQAVEEAKQMHGANDSRLAASANLLGLCLLYQGKKEAAEPLLKQALEIRRNSFGQEHSEVADSLAGLAQLLIAQQKFAEAEAFLQQCIAIREKTLGADSPEVAESLSDLASVNLDQNKYTDAEALFKRAMAIRMKDPAGESPDLAETLRGLATIYSHERNYAQAEKLLKRALELDRKQLGPDHPFLACLNESLAAVYRDQEKLTDAVPFQKQASSLKDKYKNLFACLPEDLTGLSAGGAKQLRKMYVTDELIVAEPPAQDRIVEGPVRDKWALVIGISRFKDPSINLKYAAKDAKDFHDYLVKEAGFAPDHVRLLTDEKATRENILALVGDKWLPRVAAREDLVIIYISSHGSPSKADVTGVNYLVAHDTNKDSLYATGIPLQDISRMIKDRVQSERVVIVMDACHSGAAGPKGLSRTYNVDADMVAQGTGQLVICSSDRNQVSWESKKNPNGVFTYYLLEGLRKDGGNTKLGDAFEYMKRKVEDEVRLERAAEQTPILKTKWRGNDLVLSAKAADPRPGLSDEEIGISLIEVVPELPLSSQQGTKATSPRATKPAASQAKAAKATVAGKKNVSPAQSVKSKPATKSAAAR